MIPCPSANAIVGVDDAALLLLGSLAAFGIAVTAANGIDDVGPWITDQFEEYVNSIGDSLSDVWDRFRAGVTSAGKLALDGFTLRYNAKFGEWLVDKFSLVDNSTASTGGSLYFLGDIPLSVISQNPYLGLSFTTSYPLPYYYFACSINNLLYYILVFSSSVSYNLTVRYNGAIKYQGSPRSSGSFYWCDLRASLFDNVLGSVPLASYSSISDISSYLSSHSISSSSASPVSLVTGSIAVPGSSDYDDDDGILIDGLGSWGDTLTDVLDGVGDLTLPNDTSVVDGDITYTISPADVLADSLVDVGALTTENSPGFYNGLPLIGGIPDIQFGNLWHYVTDWVSSMSGGLALIGGIMFSLPFVAAFYALVVILLVLSLWRLLRSA